MSPRLTKEIRPLLAPLLITAGVMLVPVIAWKGLYFPPSDYVFTLPLLSLVLGSGLLAAISFGVEVSERSLTFLLSQPVSRPRIWLEKFKVLLPAVAMLALAFFMVQRWIWPMAQWITDVRVLSAVSIVASLCSAPFWTGLARSTVGAVVFNFAAQFLIYAGAYTLGEWLDLPFSRRGGLAVGGVLYSAAFLLAGWWRFARAEVIEGTASVRTTRQSAGARAVFAGLIPRCRPTGKWSNLIRRELVLQQSTLQFAGVLLALVPVLYLLDLAATSPALLNFLQVVRLFPFALCMLGVTVLAGPSAFCEEKSLGTHIWSLTQPVSVRSQFLVKAAVSLSVLTICGVLLPWGFLWIYQTSFPQFFTNTNLNPDTVWSGMALVLPVFLISVRAATLFSTTIQAILATLAVTLIGGVACAITIASILRSLTYADALERDTLLWTLASGWTPMGSYLMIGSWIAILVLAGHFLQATLRSFCHPVSGDRRLLQLAWCALLPTLVAGLLFEAQMQSERAWITQNATYYKFSQSMERAISTLAPEIPAQSGGLTEFKYTAAQLRATGALDAVDAGRFHSDDQQVAFRIIQMSDQRRPATILVRLDPGIDFTENPDPGFRDVRSLRINYYKRMLR